MKRLLPLAVLLAVVIAGCGKTEPKTEPKPDPYAKYRDVKLMRGMKIANIKQKLGEPDAFDESWVETPGDYSYHGVRRRNLEHPHHRLHIRYGAFGAHSQERGHYTMHRLRMIFVDGKLYMWYKSTPLNRD